MLSAAAACTPSFDGYMGDIIGHDENGIGIIHDRDSVVGLGRIRRSVRGMGMSEDEKEREQERMSGVNECRSP